MGLQTCSRDMSRLDIYEPVRLHHFFNKYLRTCVWWVDCTVTRFLFVCHMPVLCRNSYTYY